MHQDSFASPRPTRRLLKCSPVSSWPRHLSLGGHTAIQGVGVWIGPYGSIARLHRIWLKPRYAVKVKAIVITPSLENVFFSVGYSCRRCGTSKRRSITFLLCHYLLSPFHCLFLCFFCKLLQIGESHFDRFGGVSDCVHAFDLKMASGEFAPLPGEFLGRIGVEKRAHLIASHW